MLLFSTILKIKQTLTKDDFIRLVIEWNQKSPHDNNVIPDLDWKGERNIRFGDEQLWLDIEEYRNKDIIAVRYEKRESDGIIWDTEFVMNFEKKKMAITLDRSYTEDAFSTNSHFSSPHFISLLIHNDYLENDGDLPVTDHPIEINSEKLTCLSKIIKGQSNYYLPVIYVSKTYYGENPVDINALAKQLKGVAHVLVLSGNHILGKLRDLTDNQNEYNGAIGIYYPSHALPHRRLFYRSTYGFDRILLEKVIRTTLSYSNVQKIDPLFSWQGVNNSLLQDRLTSQREARFAAENAKNEAEAQNLELLGSLDEKEKEITEKALSEAHALVESVDDELEDLQKQIDQLARVNEALKYENQGLKIKLDNMEALPAIFMGDEIEFFPGEIKEFVLSALENELSIIDHATRRADVLQDILNNNDYQHVFQSRSEEMKSLLKDYTGMSPRLRQAIEKAGFSISEEGKHYKLTYFNDGRYHTVFAKTPSDIRSGKNNAQKIVKLCY